MLIFIRICSLCNTQNHHIQSSATKLWIQNFFDKNIFLLFFHTSFSILIYLCQTSPLSNSPSCPQIFAKTKITPFYPHYTLYHSQFANHLISRSSNRSIHALSKHRQHTNYLVETIDVKYSFNFLYFPLPNLPDPPWNPLNSPVICRGPLHLSPHIFNDTRNPLLYTFSTPSCIIYPVLPILLVGKPTVSPRRNTYKTPNAPLSRDQQLRPSPQFR